MELDAHLTELELFSEAPQALGAFHAGAFGMEMVPTSDGVELAGPGRRLAFRQGPSGQIRASHFAFHTQAAWERARGRWQALARDGLLAESAACLDITDPDGRLLRFAWGGAARAARRSDLPEARLQHYALRTPHPERLLAFYVERVGFVLSDRVENEQGELTAAFLRADAEHHCLALFKSPVTRFDHFSCETADWNALKVWADHMAHTGHELAWGVGRHGPGNDTFFMVRDADGNMGEISAELERCSPGRPVGVWPHKASTLNQWGVAIMRS